MASAPVRAQMPVLTSHVYTQQTHLHLQTPHIYTIHTHAHSIISIAHTAHRRLPDAMWIVKRGSGLGGFG